MFQLHKPHYLSRTWRFRAVCSTPVNCANQNHASYSTHNHFNFYKVLGVRDNATQAQIKSAYYKLSKKYHPDRNDGSKTSQDMFSKINEAYSVLGNTKLRRRYDRGILTQRDRLGNKPRHHEPHHHQHHEPRERQSARHMGDQFTATFRSAHSEHVLDEFLKRRLRENMDKYQEEKKNRQIREEQYRLLQQKAQRTPIVILSLMLLGFGYVSMKMMQISILPQTKNKTDRT